MLTKATVYRIYTEDKDRENIARLASTYFKGFTLIPCTGFWEGSEEKSLIIEVIGNGWYLQEINNLADDIKLDNHQMTVLISVSTIEHDFI